MIKTVKKYAALCVALIGCAVFASGCGVGGTYRYDDASRYQAGNGSFDAEQVLELSVDWIAGEVILREGEGDEITFTETTDETDEDYLMHYCLERGELQIRFQNSGTKIRNHFQKTLVIEYPAGHAFRDVEIDTASADVSVSGLTATEFSADTASGEVDLQCGSVSDVSVDTASGNIALRGAFAKAECDTASGRITVTFPQSVGFRATLKTASGKVSNSTEATLDGRAYVAGNGQVILEAESASGNLVLQRETLS
ncbi:MAG: DUF4097 family beta strand repeat-containing protein [Clostridiales bacterium]|nr:DUF4097 family beta strand repeat-containing protein [Clostridiales bacterium]